MYVTTTTREEDRRYCLYKHFLYQYCYYVDVDVVVDDDVDDVGDVDDVRDVYDVYDVYDIDVDDHDVDDHDVDNVDDVDDHDSKPMKMTMIK